MDFKLSQFHLTDLFDIVDARIPERVALADEKGELTYAQLSERSALQRGEAVSSLVSLSKAMDAPSLEDVKAFCHGKLAGYKLPKTLKGVPEVQSSPTGKQGYKWAKAVLATSFNDD